MRLRSVSREGWVATGVVGMVAFAFVALSWGRISGTFGDSDEGINSSVWAYNSRSLRELGPLDSALGGRRLDNTAYATHPPLMVVEAAIAETLSGEHEWATRSPAWIGTLVAMGLLYRIGRSLGADPLVSAAATLATAATPMLFTYGFMLDTPVTSLPFGLAVALVWNRSWRATAPATEPRPEPSNPWLSLVLSLLACVAGWQSGLLVGLCGASLLVAAMRRRPGALAASLPHLAGAVMGIALSVGWGYWAYGSFDALVDKLTRRSGSAGGISPIDVVTFQVPWLFQLLGLSVIGLFSCAAALRDRTYRPLAALSLTIVGMYCLIFREAAAGHQYWIYWSLFPTAVGLTYAFASLQRATRNAGLTAAGTGGVLVGLAILMAVIDVSRGSDALTLIADGTAPADRLRAQSLPPGDAVYYIGQPFRPDSWIIYYTGRHGQLLRSEDEVARLARDQPDTPVFVIGLCEGDAADPAHHLCTRVTGSPDPDSSGRPERAPSAAELARELGIAPARPVGEGGPPRLPPPVPSAP